MLTRHRKLRQVLRRYFYPYYWATAPWRPLPSAIIIGAMKGGTTTLNDWLRLHPEISFSTIKEIHYFDENFDKGLRWYRSFFPLWEPFLGAHCALEATPAYIYRAATVAPRMHALLPNTRLILMLRDPVKRAISHYSHRLNRGLEPRTAREALISDEGWRPGTANGYKRRGLYAEQIESFLRYYPRDQLLVVKSEDFFADPGKIFEIVQLFIGVSAIPVAEGLQPKNVSRTRPEVPPEVVQHLTDYYDGPNRQLQALLPDFSLWPREGLRS